jgi:hypothetical protein
MQAQVEDRNGQSRKPQAVREKLLLTGHAGAESLVLRGVD